jgi:hypothetical protein
MRGVAQFNGFASQQAKGPMVVSIWNGAACDGDEVSLLRTSQGLAVAHLALVTHYRIYAAFVESATDGHDSIAAHIECATYLMQAPAFAQFEQDLSTRTSTGTLMPGMNKGLQATTVRFGEHDLFAGCNE